MPSLAEADLGDYDHIVVVDFEFQGEGGLHVADGRVYAQIRKNLFFARARASTNRNLTVG
jgi:hypothetical protein